MNNWKQILDMVSKATKQSIKMFILRHRDNFINTHVMEELSEGHQKPCDTSLLKKERLNQWRKRITGNTKSAVRRQTEAQIERMEGQCNEKEENDWEDSGAGNRERG